VTRIGSLLDLGVQRQMENAIQDPAPPPLAQFNRLISELRHGSLRRNCFRAWEMELLLDIGSCNCAPAERRIALRRYQKAVQRHIENGGTRIWKFSEYLSAKRPRKLREPVLP
jgi:hypothetical protein